MRTDAISLRLGADCSLHIEGHDSVHGRFHVLQCETRDPAMTDTFTLLVDALLAHHNDKLAARYETVLDGRDLPERVATIARLRDEEGYDADCHEDGDGSLVLTESNCAVHRVAEQCASVCAHEHELLRRLLGPEVEVTRTSHILAGAAACTYRVRAAASTPAAPA